MKNRNKKFLVESARITDAYIDMYRRVDEDTNDVKNASNKIKEKKTHLISGWDENGRPVTVDAVDKDNWKNFPAYMLDKDIDYTQFPQSKPVTTNPSTSVKCVLPNKVDELKKIDNLASKQPAVKIKTTEEVEYPENGDIEYTGDEEDYLMGKTNVRPKTLAPDAREKYRKTFESCGKKRGCAKKVNEADDAVKYLVAKLGKDGSPVASKGGNGAYGSQFSEFDSLADAKKKCKEMSSKSGSMCIVSKIGKDGNEKVVFKCGGKKVCEAIDVDGKELNIGDIVIIDPVGEFDFEDFVKDVIVKIKGTDVYLKNHKGKFYSGDLVKSDDGIDTYFNESNETNGGYPKDIFTLEISRVLDNGDQDGIDEMKYAKTYYDIHDAIEDAKNAYAEYADGEDNIVVDILAGEQEHESGDIWGEPYVILTVKDGKLLDATGAEVDTTEEEFIGNIDDANESYEDNGEIDYGDDGSKYAEDYADDKLKNAISVIKRICAKNGAKVTGISEGDRTHAIVNIKIKDPTKVTGGGFDLNRIMGIGYGIEKACEKAGINAFIAGGYIGNNAQLYLSKAFPIIESVEEERKYGIMNGAGDWFLNGTAQEITGEEFGPDAESAFRFTHDGAYKNLQQWQNNGDDEEYEVRILPPTNEEILVQYRKFLGNAMPVIETKEGEIYFEYDPKRNVLAYGGASNVGLLEDGHIDYDKSQSMQWNLEQLHDEIYEKYGYLEEE